MDGDTFRYRPVSRLDLSTGPDRGFRRRPTWEHGLNPALGHTLSPDPGHRLSLDLPGHPARLWLQGSLGRRCRGRWGGSLLLNPRGRVERPHCETLTVTHAAPPHFIFIPIKPCKYSDDHQIQSMCPTPPAPGTGSQSPGGAGEQHTHAAGYPGHLGRVVDPQPRPQGQTPCPLPTETAWHPPSFFLLMAQIKQCSSYTGAPGLFSVREVAESRVVAACGTGQGLAGSATAAPSAWVRITCERVGGWVT